MIDVMRSALREQCLQHRIGEDFRVEELRIAWRSVPDLPSMAAWHHRDARTGFEVLFLRRDGRRFRFDGYSTAVQEGECFRLAWLRSSPELTTRA
jgi:hypothetical protein